jgi:hypothetical protein
MATQPRKARTAVPRPSPSASAGPNYAAQGGQPYAIPPQVRINSKTGQSYTVHPAQGGSWHTYSDGRRVFVRARATPAAGSSQPAQQQPATDSAASVQAAGPDLQPDAQYYADTAADTFRRNQESARLTAEDTSDEINYREALRRFREQRPKQLRGALENANDAGLAQSTYLSERQADINIQNTRQETDMSGAFTGRKAAREAARQALASGASIEEAGRLAEAAGRRVEYFSERADENSLARNGKDPIDDPKTTTSAAAAPRPRVTSQKPQASSTTKPKFKTVTKNGKVYRYYGTGANTRKVYKRKARR